MEETKIFLNLLDEKFYPRMVSLEDNSEKELKEIKSLKDSLSEISSKNKILKQLLKN